MSHFTERLLESMRDRETCLCVGLDPRLDKLPDAILDKYGDSNSDQGRVYEEFCLRVLDIVAPHVGVVKPQSAFFEACGPRGMTALQRVINRARELDLIVILDAKRNDIASTAEAYAEAAFHFYRADALTVNAYLGEDSIQPFLDTARRAVPTRGLFVLVRTSNPGAGRFQDLKCDGRPLYTHVAQAVADWGKQNLSPDGFGDVGAVIGATHPKELKSLRKQLEHTMFLVPGYGAQGAGVEEVRQALRPDGTGAIVNSSRGVIFPFDPSDNDWEQSIEAAAKKAADELRWLGPDSVQSAISD